MTALAMEQQSPRWVGVCEAKDIAPDSGVCALIDGEQVAILHLGATGEFFGLSNFDPFSKAFVISRGIVGDRQGTPKVASPMYKQSFDLRTGVCLDDPSVCLRTYPVRVRVGRLEVLFPGSANN